MAHARMEIIRRKVFTRIRKSDGARCAGPTPEHGSPAGHTGAARFAHDHTRAVQRSLAADRLEPDARPSCARSSRPAACRPRQRGGCCRPSPQAAGYGRWSVRWVCDCAQRSTHAMKLTEDRALRTRGKTRRSRRPSRCVVRQRGRRARGPAAGRGAPRLSQQQLVAPLCRLPARPSRR